MRARRPLSVLVLGVLLGLPLPAFAQDAAKADPWAGFRWLLGNWRSDDKPGEATGAFTFRLDLAERILVRDNHADVPAAKDRPASRHDDLLVTFPDPAGAGVRATYWDNEGHVIAYRVEPDAGKTRVTWTSEPGAGPRFRLTIAATGPDAARITFGMAPPGKDEFRTYLEGVAKRVK